jgi:hypothetical protein
VWEPTEHLGGAGLAGLIRELESPNSARNEIRKHVFAPERWQATAQVNVTSGDAGALIPPVLEHRITELTTAAQPQIPNRIVRPHSR